VLEEAGWAKELFASVDVMDTEAFLDFLEDDARFRFGGAPVVVGKEAIRSAIDGFFASIKGLRHDIVETWVQGQTVICQGDVTYTRTDGSEVTIPFATIWRMRNGRIREYLIYIDINPLWQGHIA
jgi:ketosteroid isomerase-like protein